jgi:site-specific recombinase XerD
MDVELSPTKRGSFLHPHLTSFELLTFVVIIYLKEPSFLNQKGRHIMTELRKRMLEDLQLAGKSPRTQVSYVRAVRQLAEHFNKSPGLITEHELREYFLYVKNVKGWSRSTLTLAICGIKFFCERTLKRSWTTLDIIRPQKEKKLPVILAREEISRILYHIRFQNYHVCLLTIYSCGLRLSEGTNLQVTDIDSQRTLLHVRSGKGKKDRYVPLPQKTLQHLRVYYKSHRNPVWIFPAVRRGNNKAASTATKPNDVRNVQNAFRAALKASGINKPASVHTLRHSYATHLVEQGVNLRLVQEYLGHSSLQTTTIYAHLTEIAQSAASEVINKLVDDLTV